MGKDTSFPSRTGPGGYGPSNGIAPGTVLLSATPGKLYAYGQSLFVKPFASVNLYSYTQKQEIPIIQSLTLRSSFFTGASKTYRFTVQNPQQTAKAQLLFLIQQGTGTITIELNDQEIFSGALNTGELPIFISPQLLKSRNTITFSVSAGVFGKNNYQLRDVSLFLSDRQQHVQEARDFVFSQSQLDNLDSLTLFYFVNCFTVQEQGTLQIRLNGNVLNQYQIVCDAGEISQDIPSNFLIPGRNILEFFVDQGKFVLEQITLEGNAGQGRVPGYFFTLQRDDAYNRVPLWLDLKFYDNRERNVATVFINGYPLYVDTYDPGVLLDLTPYVTEGQNVIKLLPQTELDVIDLTVYLG